MLIISVFTWEYMNNAICHNSNHEDGLGIMHINNFGQQDHHLLSEANE